MPRHHFNLNWVRRCIFISVAPTIGLCLSRVSYVSHNLPLGISLHWRYPSAIIGPLVFKVVFLQLKFKGWFPQSQLVLFHLPQHSLLGMPDMCAPYYWFIILTPAWTIVNCIPGMPRNHRHMRLSCFPSTNNSQLDSNQCFSPERVLNR